jgi:hypothetical protein
MPKVAAPNGNIRMKNRVNSGKPDSADADMVILSQARSHRVVSSEREGAETKG